MLSSLLKGYVQFILSNRGMVKIIEILSKRLELENGVSKFYEFMTKTFPAKKSYVGLQYMQTSLGCYPCSDPMRHILGVTLRHYLKEHFLLNLFQGNKLKKKMRLDLLKKIRTV